MIIIGFILLTAFVIWIVVEALQMIEEGTPAKDSDILEMLELKGKDYEIHKTWDGKFRLKTYRTTAPTVYPTSYSLLFPYYIEEVGMVPFWYKSADKIRELFEQKIANSKFQVTKRDKLGLN